MAERTVEPNVIETERLLRPWIESDAEPYRDLWSKRDPQSLRAIDADGKPTLDDLREHIRTRLTTPSRTGLGLLVVQRRDGEDFIGYCGFTHRELTPAEPGIAYELLRHAHGRGYATEAAVAALTRRARLVSPVGRSPQLELLRLVPRPRQDRVYRIGTGR